MHELSPAACLAGCSLTITETYSSCHATDCLAQDALAGSTAALANLLAWWHSSPLPNHYWLFAADGTAAAQLPAPGLCPVLPPCHMRFRVLGSSICPQHSTALPACQPACLALICTIAHLARHPAIRHHFFPSRRTT
jgi:hypothetical protein